MTEGRDARGRFLGGPSPDRGRGRPRAASGLLIEEDLRQLLVATASLPVSVPRGRGRRVVTLYEAMIRRLATGSVPRRAAVMTFIRLVQGAAAQASAGAQDRAPQGSGTAYRSLSQLQAAAQAMGSVSLDAAMGLATRIAGTGKS